MDLLKRICILVLICLSCLSHANEETNIGIALLHGTNDHREDANGIYWKRSFIDELAKGLAHPDNQVIIACNFREMLWHPDVAGCLVDQLLTFVNQKHITHIVVYGHSHGPNVMRWILSNPTYDPKYALIAPKIAQIIAIAPSSGGTPLADEVIDGGILEESLGWLLGFANDSVRQQRVGDMALLNAELLLGTPGRPSLPVPFRSVVGTGVTASPLTKASYCNGYMLNLGLKFTQLYLENCSDGFLGCGSQNLAGNLWFYDWQKTQEKTPLSHNQSRHSCFGFEQILRNDLVHLGATL